MMRDIYVAIASLRNSADLLSSHLNQWLFKVVKFAPDRGTAWMDRWRALWLALGVDLQTTELLVVQLQLHWDGESMWVRAGINAELDVVDAIASALMAIWRFQKFTDSRWLTVGTSARTVVAALLTGIEDMVKVISEDKHCSKFYIKGFSRLEESRKQFLVTAALASRVPEAFQLELMHDSRVALHYDHLWKTLSEELQWVIGFPFPCSRSSVLYVVGRARSRGLCAWKLLMSHISSSGGGSLYQPASCHGASFVETSLRTSRSSQLETAPGSLSRRRFGP